MKVALDLDLCHEIKTIKVLGGPWGCCQELQKGCIGVVINVHEHSVRIAFHVTNNMVEYDTAIIGVLTSRKLQKLIIYSESGLMVNQCVLI